MKIEVHYSSSAGNLYTVKSGDTLLLLECGVSPQKILKATDYKLHEYSGCLLSHSHRDHSKSIEFVLRSGIKVYSTKETFDTMKIYGESKKIGEIFEIGNFYVKLFQTEHDCVGSCGFLILDKISGKKMIFATDTYFLKQKFTGLNYIMIECNYCEELLQADKECGYADRLRKSHMSLDNLKLWIDRQDHSKLEKIYLMHLSDGHSDEKRFKEEIEKIVFADVEICDKG